ncbi:GBF-interacting protein 1-like [Andrographis paniculata]|uniref:GBF-interacting protein 1-like n=1 Tax=Andrographis paniculata TaxID=175694 RepID=UPI0021E834F9|nr:GBF-interacting protein 1-like [Andrographis paniculata]
MSSGVKASAGRVSIPSGVRKTIENIKEITGQNHSEDEIYAMLRDCSMDPNETAQKLLQLDTFHEVRRKRDKRKENQNKEPAELKWKQGAQARSSRVSRGNYSLRYTSNVTSGGRGAVAPRESATSNLPEKGIGKVPVVGSQDMRKNAASSIASPIAAVSNGPSGVTSKDASVVQDNHASRGGVNLSNTSTSIKKSEGPLQPQPRAKSIENDKSLRNKDIQQQPILEISTSPAPASGFLTSSGPVMSSSQDFSVPSTVGTVEVGNQDVTAELIGGGISESKSSSAKTSTSKLALQSGSGRNQPLDPMPVTSSTGGVSIGSRPASSYNNRSQVIGQQKVGPGKEWKPKSTNAHNSQSVATAPSSEASTVSVGCHTESQTTPVVPTSEEATLGMQRKFEELHISDSQHVIIPNHLHVPEVAKLGFCFGSFDASFGLDVNPNGVPGSDELPPLSEPPSEATDEPVQEPQTSNQSPLAVAENTETNYPDCPPSPSQQPENVAPNEVEVSLSVAPDFSEAKPEVSTGSHQTVVRTSSAYNLGFIPSILSGQLTSESSESQARDASRLPNFVVPQSFDAASYYAQFYRSGMDSDGRISPFHPPGAASKFNGNAALISAQTSQAPQELQGGVPLILSTASPSPLVTQAAGVMQSSATQQPLPVFRQPTGVHLPHYPPNYLPYGPYFSPFYVPPPAIHQFLSNGAYPQQPQASSLHPTAPGTAAKYSASQYKQGSNAASSAHVGLPGSYGPYGLTMANYASSSAAAAVTSTSSEDIGGPQIKDNNVYPGGQQNEGSGVWFTAPNRDISALTASSFYNLPQGQIAFTPTQPGHGAFTGIFHPAQAMTAANVHPLLQQSQPITNAMDMAGPTANVYQQPQHAQLNWPSNY